MADLKKAKKKDKYANMLKTIELNPEDNINMELSTNKEAEEDHVKNTNNKVSLMDLISTTEHGEGDATGLSLLKNQLKQLDTKSELLQEIPSINKKEKLERKANTKIIHTEVKKWQDIIKRNRENDHLNLVENHSLQEFRINATAPESIVKTDLEVKMEAKLKELNMLDQENAMKNEKEMLKNLSAKEAKQKLKELAKNRSLMFYQELKQKRISKIKSKLYHKIKKKRVKYAQAKVVEAAENADPSYQLQQIEEQEKKRADERVSMRHKTQSKFIKNILRFAGDKKASINTVTDLNQLRKEILKKLDPEYKKRLSQKEKNEDLDDGDVNDNDDIFKKKVMEELEKELEKQGENENSKDKSKKSFIEKFLDKQTEKSKQEAQELLQKLKNADNLSDIEVSEEEDIGKMDRDDIENYEKKGNTEEKPKKDEKFFGRKKFQKEENSKNLLSNTYGSSTNRNNAKANDVLKNYVENQDEVAKVNVKVIQNPNKKTTQSSEDQQAQTNNDLLWLKSVRPIDVITETTTENGKSTKVKIMENDKKSQTKEEDNIFQGLKFDNLKKKYKKNLEPNFQQSGIEQFDEENENELYKELQKNNIITADMNEEEFIEEKKQLYEEKIPQEPKSLKGWGNWTGIGITEPKVNKEAELKKKIDKIENLKKQRTDGKLDNVIIHEERNKLVTQYLVSELPHPFKNADQYNYLQSIPLGPEVNTLRNYQKLTKPKIITKAGSIIKPIKSFKVGKSQEQAH